MDNWLFFVIIIIGIISSFLNKKTKTVTKGPIARPGYDQPMDYPASEKNYDYKPLEVEYQTAAKKEPIEASGQFKKPEYHNYEGMEGREGFTEPKAKFTTNSYTPDKQKSEANLVQKDEGSKLEADQLLQGMIWAEILGSPRSKKPHNSLEIRNKI